MTKHATTPRWTKSSYSGNQGGECVEIAALAQTVGIRDSKDVARGFVQATAPSWTVLTEALRAG